MLTVISTKIGRSPRLFSRLTNNVHLGGIKRYLATETRQSHVIPQMQEEFPYWQKIPRWKDHTAVDFLSYKWQVEHSARDITQLSAFMSEVLPQVIPQSSAGSGQYHPSPPKTSVEMLRDFDDGAKKSSMSVRLTPHILSLIDWQKPLDDPLFRQFIPLASRMEHDHPLLKLDPNAETKDSPVRGVIHRYPDKVVFLASSVCPVYCRFCTRSYAVGVETSSVSKKQRFLPILKKWQPMLDYIRDCSAIEDVLVSGGDGYTLSAEQLELLCTRLFAIPHVRRVRIASKGIGICPSRILPSNDGHDVDDWAATVISLSKRARQQNKNLSLQTHINHPREMSWVTTRAALRLYREGVSVRNQTVLLNGVNNDVKTMSDLIRTLAHMNITPYYVLQCDMIKGCEDLRTPLYEIVELERQIRGSISGWMTPNFILHLPEGGGKRLASVYETYNRKTGQSTFTAPLLGKGDEVYEYYDPLRSLPPASLQ